MATNHTDPKYLDESFQKICDELLATFIQKHKDYGKGNILSIKELGIAFRLTEKIERLKNLLMNPGTDPLNESIADNIKDIAVYAIVMEMFRRGEFQKLSLKP
ncbi:hypothetical protein KBD75_00145 [Candidatus Woesebacteria bacterium]|nr:hypothetical protein [Candidatus Woesebacteria bacterium]